jgi:hypothetical protein
MGSRLAVPTDNVLITVCFPPHATRPANLMDNIVDLRTTAMEGSATSKAYCASLGEYCQNDVEAQKVLGVFTSMGQFHVAQLRTELVEFHFRRALLEASLGEGWVNIVKKTLTESFGVLHTFASPVDTPSVVGHRYNPGGITKSTHLTDIPSVLDLDAAFDYPTYAAPPALFRGVAGAKDAPLEKKVGLEPLMVNVTKLVALTTGVLKQNESGMNVSHVFDTIIKAIATKYPVIPQAHLAGGAYKFYKRIATVKMQNFRSVSRRGC